MTSTVFSPPYSPPHAVAERLQQVGFAVLAPDDVAQWVDAPLSQLHVLDADWDDLPPDEYLKDGGRYRRRRHACFTVCNGQVNQVPHRAHWQPLQYNALHGGMQRWFAAVEPSSLQQPAWAQLLSALARTADTVFAAPILQEASSITADVQPVVQAPAQQWFAEAHQFRIDTLDGIGRPTPEGAHRDGVDLVAVFVVGRHQVKGGETRVFEAAGPNGQRFTLTQPWSLLLLDDARMIHESTPIQPLDTDSPQGYRDTLVVTLRREGFQGE
jgi:hypothetical protein